MSGAAELLTRAAEELDSVVDAEARARLQAEYLGLLREYHAGRGRQRADLPQRVQSLYSRVRMARVNYKLWPGLGLGPLDARFWNAYQSAGAILKRLDSLAARAPEVALREMRRRELRDLREMIDKLRDEVERVATSSVNLSRMETHASQLNNIISVHLLSRERQWGAELRQPAPVYAPRGVTSGVISMITRPDIWQSRIAGLGDWWQDYGAAVSGAWKARREQVLKSARAGWAKWQSSVKRLGAIRPRLQKLAARNPALAAQLEQRRSSLVALARSVATGLKQVVGWTDPMKFYEMHLAGDGEAERSAGILLHTGDVEQLDKGTAELERALAAAR